MRVCFRILLLFILPTLCLSDAVAQTHELQQLYRKAGVLKKHKNYLSDTSYTNTLNLIAESYAQEYPDSAISILDDHEQRYRLSGYKKGEMNANQILANAYLVKGNYKAALDRNEAALDLAKKTSDETATARIEGNVGLVYLNQGMYQQALQNFYASQKIAERIDNKSILSSSLNNIGTIQFYQGNMKEAEQAYLKTLSIAKEQSDTFDIVLAYNNLGEVNIEKKEYAKALHNLSRAYQLSKQGNVTGLEAPISNSLGTTYYALDSTSKALTHFEHALAISRQQGNARANCKALLGLAKVYLKQNKPDLALTNGLEGLKMADDMAQTQLLRDANEIVASIYEAKGDGNNAIRYFKKFKFFADSLVNIENERVAANYKADFEYSQKEMAFERKSSRQRGIIFLSVTALFSLLVILWVINRNRKKISKTNIELKQKSLIIEEQKARTEKTLSDLRTTQNQLIQSEKMASLGELAAGIAHEIQNPLNFVNNFSEVSKELLQEMKTEMDRGNSTVANEIAADVIQNLDKINSHGKRADAIVKGMLQHSRNSGGQKEMTDINALIHEYVRLSYYGLKAKDSTFKASIKTDFDDTVPRLNIIPQEIGRVILNILTNAFYAVEEKRKDGVANYSPSVHVQTKKLPDKVEIRISDNGNGIPAGLTDKIFQPFFTTKPSGQGTGLGLSLSYDMVTKGHNGTLNVSSVTAQTQARSGGGATGTTFTIQLPLK